MLVDYNHLISNKHGRRTIVLLKMLSNCKKNYLTKTKIKVPQKITHALTREHCILIKKVRPMRSKESEN